MGISNTFLIWGTYRQLLWKAPFVFSYFKIILVEDMLLINPWNPWRAEKGEKTEI